MGHRAPAAGAEPPRADGSVKPRRSSTPGMSSLFRRFRREKKEDATETAPEPTPAADAPTTPSEEPASPEPAPLPGPEATAPAPPEPEPAAPPPPLPAAPPPARAATADEPLTCFLCGTPMEGHFCPRCRMEWAE